ncbi:uncharacterized protein EI90DRAFT_3026410 [Cantharellus anzutake]|uniref:uncharacterized protein n=1 Tax=Cantharellus anzutake TaxID=1750568 RepID=UPI00190539AB|nr:uncharacterized protein EI90DRAFT_3026410 [Cantharellus anzutake]KAF8307578.1 hypothetical protein EI90DRAFT_3026410 [Cantharellus anzutake]
MSTMKAMMSGLSGENSDNLDHFKDTAPLCSPDLDTSSDILLFNNILLYRDMLFYWEFRSSIKDSDIGRTFEVIKRPLSQWLRVWFFGASATNYGQELLHQALDLWFHFTEKMKNAVFNNYVISPSGRGDGCRRDLLQEHSNFWLKQVFNGHLAKFDSSFLRRLKADIAVDINFLGHSYLTQRHHIYQPGQVQSFLAVDSIERGSAKLEEGALQKFLDKHFYQK